MKPEETVIVALDMNNEAEIIRFLEVVDGRIPHVKLASTAYAVGGPALVRKIRKQWPMVQIMLDLKLYDIPHQMASTVAALTQLGVEAVTVHTSAQSDALRMCVEAAENSLTIVGVTVLTSMSTNDVHGTFNTRDVSWQVRMLAMKAQDAGVRSLVCSGHELVMLKDDPTLRRLLLRVPGIRMKDSPVDDQARKVTPGAAIKNGAKRIVVGRPITQAEYPVVAYSQIVEEVRAAMT